MFSREKMTVHSLVLSFSVSVSARMTNATEEYGADLAGRIVEKGFEKMSAEELTFWGKLKNMLQKALQIMRRKTWFGEAADISKQMELKVGEFADRDTAIRDTLIGIMRKSTWTLMLRKDSECWIPRMEEVLE